jgi:hypothetical protein
MRAKSIILGFIFILMLPSTYGAKIKYSCENLPKELTENANAIIREWDEQFIVSDKGHATYYQHFVITILNKNADNWAYFSEHYSKLSKITSYKGFVYDASGKEIKKIKPDDFIDVGNYDYYTLYSDDRSIHYKPTINNYPCTYEFIWEEKYDGLLSYPIWYPRPGADMTVEKASFKIVMPKNITLKYKEYNIIDSVKITHIENKTEYLWQTSNLLAIENEPNTVGLNEISPYVKIVPEICEIEGYEGNISDWKSFGEFITKLNEQDNTLSEKTKLDIKQITNSTTDKREIAKRIYEYMQSKTRYVSIQVGIGGWKPFSASVVDKYGYGDCKALSNYTKTLLKEAGIESIYTLAYASTTGLDIPITFPTNYFNHAILCVPLEQDTIWLECTSQVLPFGFMGSFTHNRHVLLIKPEGGELAFIPEYKLEQNKQIRKIEVNLTDLANAPVIVKTFYSGLQYENAYRMPFLNSDEQKKEILNKIDIPNYNLLNWNYKEDKKMIPEITENLSLQVNNYTSTSGKRVFLPLNMMNKFNHIPSLLKERKTSIYFRTPYIDSDTVVYTIPANLKVEFIPEKKEVVSDFGNYKSSVTVNNSTVTYVRTMSRKSGIYPASKYKELVDFYKQVSNADNIKLSLVKTD